MWIDFQKDKTASHHLYCFPYAGGGANMFRAWAQKAPSQVKVHSFLLPGRETLFKVPPFTSMEKLIDSLSNTIDNLQFPCIFFGYSLGALIAFEWLIKMFAQNKTLPQALVVAAMSAPHREYSKIAFNTMDDNALLHYLTKDPDYPGTHSPELLEFQRLLLPTLRADHALYENYVPRPAIKLPLPIIAMYGNQDPEHSRSGIQGWQDFTHYPQTLREFSGSHMFLHQHNQDIFAELLAILLQPTNPG